VRAAVGSGEQVVLAAEGDGADGAFDGVVVEFDAAVIEESGERWPARERITNGLGERAGRWDAAKLHLEPRLHHLDERPGAGITNLPTRVCGAALDRSLDRVEFGELNTLAPVHDIDHPDVELQAPVLVTDADASQVSAVIDVAGGTSLVIQGPPGTGKSQTITNVIANAMWQGKSILFVSEKMAALGVVKDRLDHMGLGLFCLEVHSAKASKAQVLHALKDRMDAGRIGSNGEEIERARTALQQARQRLSAMPLPD
jgi:hypothetical protein